jgi:hypothetical protein
MIGSWFEANRRFTVSRMGKINLGMTGVWSDAGCGKKGRAQGVRRALQ